MVKIKDKKKFIRGISLIVILLILIVLLVFCIFRVMQPNEEKQKEKENLVQVSSKLEENETTQEPEVLKQWNLKLVNKNVSIEKDYAPELATIEGKLQFDERAIGYLNKMMTAIRKSGITSIWIQSSYRSYEKQAELFNNKVDYYKQKGNTQEEAEALAQKLVQRAEQSEHNLGLAVDFNKVNNDFEDTKAFTWLQEHAQEYGFILRYPKDKEEITGVSYESWHWRYVGEEHAKIIKEKGYCLEEYIEYLKGTQQV